LEVIHHDRPIPVRPDPVTNDTGPHQRGSVIHHGPHRRSPRRRATPASTRRHTRHPSTPPWASNRHRPDRGWARTAGAARFTVLTLLTLGTATTLTLVSLLVLGEPASAATLNGAPPRTVAMLAVYDLPTVVNNATRWLVGFLATLATFFLTLGGVRYLTSGGDPSEVERAKGSFKNAGIGYALAVLAQ
jgi:hypothetical protein